jgi:hypothetical protein
MSHSSQTSRTARVGIAIGFAVCAIAAVMSNASAGTTGHVASGAVTALPASTSDLGAQVDWSRVQAANITPAETVAAYER